MGEFPKSVDELMCEPWFLRSIGISSENMLGASIEIEGEKYVVSGLLADSSYGEADVKTATFIKAKQSGQTNNSIMIDLDCEVTDELRDEFYEYFLEAEELEEYEDIKIEGSAGINASKMIATSDTKESSEGVFLFVFMVLFLAAVMIMYNYMLLFMNRITDNTNNFLRLGLSKFAIMSAISRVICTVIVIFNLIGAGCYCVFSKGIHKYVVERDIRNYEYIVSDIVSDKVISVFVCLTLLEIVLVYIKMLKIFYGKNYIKDGRFGKVYNINPKKYNERKTFLSMARNNLKMSRCNNVLTILALSVAICAYITMTYYVKNIDATEIDYDNVQYILRLPYDTNLNNEQCNQKKELVNRITGDERLGAIIRNVYYTKSNIDKKRISDDYMEYLKLYYEYSALIGNNLTTKLPLNIAVMSSEQLKLDIQLELENNQGVFYNTSTCYEIHDAIDISKGDTIDISSADWENKKIEIVHVDNSKKINIFSDNMCLVLVVNQETFDEISDRLTPEKIYLTKKISEEFLLDYLKDIDFVQIERLDFDDQTVDASVTEVEIVLFLILCVCAVVLFVSLLVSCNTRIKVFSKEYKTLFSIGLPLRYVLRVPIYEMCIILAEIAGISFIGSYITTKLAYQLSEMKIMYTFPMMNWGKTLAVVSFLILLCIAYNVRAVKKIEHE